MPLIQDIAVVSGNGATGAAIKRALGPTDIEQDLPAAAWMVHQYMLGEAQRASGEPVAGAEPGVEWITWRGTLSHALVSLDIGDPKKEDEFSRIRKMVSYRLRDHGNAVCLVRGGRNGRGDVTKWAVRTMFREAEASPELPVLKMTASYTQPMPKRTTTTAHTTPLPPPSSAAQRVTTTIASTVASPRIARADSIPCPSCNTIYHKVYLGRHFYSTHTDPAAIVLDAIQQRGTAYRTELAEILSEVAGGAVISASYVGTVLVPALDEVPPRVKFHRGFGGNCYYIWLGDGNANANANGTAAVKQGALNIEPATMPATTPVKPVMRDNDMDPHGVLDAASGGNEALRQVMYATAHQMSTLSTHLTTVAKQLASAANNLSISDDEREELIQLRLLRDQFRELAGGK